MAALSVYKRVIVKLTRNDLQRIWKWTNDFWSGQIDDPEWTLYLLQCTDGDCQDNDFDVMWNIFSRQYADLIFNIISDYPELQRNRIWPNLLDNGRLRNSIKRYLKSIHMDILITSDCKPMPYVAHTLQAKLLFF